MMKMTALAIAIMGMLLMAQDPPPCDTTIYNMVSSNELNADTGQYTVGFLSDGLCQGGDGSSTGCQFTKVIELWCRPFGSRQWYYAGSTQATGTLTCNSDGPVNYLVNVFLPARFVYEVDCGVYNEDGDLIASTSEQFFID